MDKEKKASVATDIIEHFASELRDTHPIVWYFTEDPNLSEKALEVFEGTIKEGIMGIAITTECSKSCKKWQKLLKQITLLPVMML